MSGMENDPIQGAEEPVNNTTAHDAQTGAPEPAKEVKPGSLPPAGTYPSPNTPPQPPKPEPKTRRVGSITMALSLIAVGVIMVLNVFVPNIDYVFIARLSPVVLVFLGLEMLWANLRHKGERLRYDFLSVLFSLILIVASLAAVVLPQVYRDTVVGDKISSRLAYELEQTAWEKLDTLDDVKVTRAEWYVNLKYGNAFEDMAVADIQPEDYVQLRITLSGDYENAADFAADCQKITSLLGNMVTGIDYASFYSFDDHNSNNDYAGDMRFSLWLDNDHQFTQSAAELENLIYVEYWVGQDNTYVSAAEWQERLDHPEWYAIENEGDADNTPYGDEDYGGDTPSGSDPDEGEGTEEDISQPSSDPDAPDAASEILAA